jgi:hypothetical protein
MPHDYWTQEKREKRSSIVFEGKLPAYYHPD